MVNIKKYYLKYNSTEGKYYVEKLPSRKKTKGKTNNKTPAFPPSFFVLTDEQINKQISYDNESYQSVYSLDGLISLINQQRFNNGMKDLSISPTLMELARLKARDWSFNDYPFSSEHSPRSHISPRLGSPLEQARSYNYYFYPVELGGQGYNNNMEVLEGWLESSSHAPWIINPSYASDFTNIGVGYFFNPNSKYKNYWVLIMSDERSGKEYFGSYDPYKNI